MPGISAKPTKASDMTAAEEHVYLDAQQSTLWLRIRISLAEKLQVCSHPEGQPTPAPLNRDGRAWDGKSGLKRLQEQLEGRAGLSGPLDTLKPEDPWPA